MNQSERMWLREKENKAYLHMQDFAKLYGRQSTEFQSARAKWMAYHEICTKFEIEEIVNDGII